MYWTILFAKDTLRKFVCKKMCAATNNVCAMYGVQRRLVVVEELPNRCYETSEHLLALLFQGQPLRFRIIIVIQHTCFAPLVLRLNLGGVFMYNLLPALLCKLDLI